MRRFRNLVIGGIQNKVFNLILFAVILLVAAFSIISASQNNMLSRLAAESTQRQEAGISEITSTVMDQVVTQALRHSNQTEAALADEMFASARERIEFLRAYAEDLLAHPSDHAAHPYAVPDPTDDGTWTAKVLYPAGVDPSDPALCEKLGLIANMTDVMINVCRSFRADTVYVALPEGAHFSVSATSSSWYTDGSLRSYDPRVRDWYKRAAETGSLIFSDGEWDAGTGVYCIECAAPVYGPDGSLQAVVGTDLFLDEMQAVMQGSDSQGEYALLINQIGHALIAPQEDTFPMARIDRRGDLRDSQYELLSKTVRTALQGSEVGITQGKLRDGVYYITASPIPTTGWVLISAFSQAVAGRPETMLRENYALIQAQTTEAYRDQTGRMRVSAFILVFLIALLTLSVALLLGKRIVRPLNTITRRISEISEDNLAFEMEDVYRTGDEVEELAKSFSAISHRTVEYLDTVKRVTAEKERIGTELSMATQIQAAMLPHIVPAFPDRTDFDIIGSMKPAKEVGGDFYDYFLVDDDHLCMVMADVSGKGVPAALFMMACKIILQSIAMLGNAPAEVLARTNETVCSNNEAEMFVTVWLGILELSTGKLTAANAGHEYPVFRHPGGKYELFKDKHGFVIGGMEGVRYREYTVQLEPGSRLFLYTDGVPEATDAREELFGTERMLDALNGCPENTAPIDVLKAVHDAVDGFVQEAQQFDDMTMLCLEYKGPDAADKED